MEFRWKLVWIDEFWGKPPDVSTSCRAIGLTSFLGKDGEPEVRETYIFVVVDKNIVLYFRIR